MEDIVKGIIKGIANAYGQDFFERITLQLDKAISADYTFIARLNEAKYTSRTIALVAHGELVGNIEYSLEHTPCANVADDSCCIYPHSVISRFPQDQLLIDMNIEAYLGTPLHDSSGNVMGLVVALYERPIVEQELTLALFQLFADRIAGEIERHERETELVELNETLDQRVKERTAELEQAQQRLIESEKLAALGELVAGVAHEVNTPLGVAITAESMLSDGLSDFKKKLSKGGITRRDMDDFLELQNESLPIIERNLNRAKILIENFKQTATDQHSQDVGEISLTDYYQKIISTLTPLLKKKKAKVTFTGCQNDRIRTYPGCHAQLLTNLINNSIEHGFEQGKKNRITITLQRDKSGLFTVDFRDNGVGIPENILDKVLTPFFSTAKGKGNSGLGLSICHNLVAGKLNGQFSCLPSKEGAHFRYQFWAQTEA